MAHSSAPIQYLMLYGLINWKFESMLVYVGDMMRDNSGLSFSSGVPHHECTSISFACMFLMQPMLFIAIVAWHTEFKLADVSHPVNGSYWPQLWPHP